VIRDFGRLGKGEVIGSIITGNETNAIDFFHPRLSVGIIRVDRLIFCATVADVIENIGLIGQEVCDEMEVPDGLCLI
tara:strand:- start:315 stop:545 length:231 start_codon:yes stop_codon:yes gene_type:complete